MSPNESMLRRLREVSGPNSVSRDPNGSLMVTPPALDALAGVMGLAHDEGWRVAIEGASTWRSENPPADLTVSTRSLDEVESPGESRVVLAGAGTTIGDLRCEALDHHAWLPLDPPGRSNRTIGSVAATGTAGPLRHGLGPVRAQLTGVTVVTGNGGIHRTLALRDEALPEPADLHVGIFGWYGVIAECSVQLLPIPASDATMITVGDRDTLIDAARDIIDSDTALTALELCSPAIAAQGDWTLAARMIDSHAAVDESTRRLRRSGVVWHEPVLEPPESFWNRASVLTTSVPVTVRLSAVPAAVELAIDLLTTRLGDGLISATPSVGSIRWSGVAEAESLRKLRAEATSHEIFMTLERAPWRIRRAIGHFGAYREHRNADEGRREMFDPAGILVTALDGGTEP